MTTTFRPSNFAIAQFVRQFTNAELSKRSGLSPKEIKRLLDGDVSPREETVISLAKALEFPLEFFFGVDRYMPDVATFRKYASLSKRELNAGKAAGSLGAILADWLDENYTDLPPRSLPDLSMMRDDPEEAAGMLRAAHNIGQRPLGNVVAFVESCGVRVFALSQDTLKLNAYATWKGDREFIFLNNQKSAESSRFDVCHELAHLCLHNNGDQGKDIEEQANRFASAFLMPRHDVLANRVFPNLENLIRQKQKWGVSLSALVYRYRELGLLTPDRAKFLYIQMSRAGYLKKEPQPRGRDKSVVWKMVLEDLWRQRKTLSNVANETGLPLDAVEGLVPKALVNMPAAISEGERPILKLVD